MEGGLATVYSFVDLAILRVGLGPVPVEAVATPKDRHCSTFKTGEMARLRHLHSQSCQLMESWADREGNGV